MLLWCHRVFRRLSRLLGNSKTQRRPSLRWVSTHLPRWTSNTALWEIPFVQGGQGTAPVRHVAQTEIVVVVEIGAPLPTESATPMFVAAPVLVSPPVVVKYVQSAPIVEYVTPTPAVTYAHASLDVEYVATPALTVSLRTVASPVFPTERQCRSPRFQSRSVVAVHRQGRRHPCRGAEADP